MKHKLIMMIIVAVLFVLISFWLTTIAGLANIAEYASSIDKYFGIVSAYIAYWPSLLLHIPQKYGFSNALAMKINHIGWGLLGILLYLLLPSFNGRKDIAVSNIFKRLPLIIGGVVLGTLIWFFRNITAYSSGFLLGPLSLTDLIGLRGASVLFATQLYFLTILLSISSAKKSRIRILTVILCIHILIGIAAVIFR